MSLADTLRVINSLDTEIDQQKRLVNDFLYSNRENIALVRRELKGSSRGYDQMMLNALRQAEDALTKSQRALSQATDAIHRVRDI